jgi:anti-sigma factor RsiW
MRRLLWPESDSGASAAEIARARAHVVECESCRRFMDEMHSLARDLRALGSGESAPPEVRERVRARVADARTAHRPQIAGRRRAALWLVTAASVAGLAFLYARVGVETPGTQVIGAVVEDHLRALHQQAIESSEPAAVERWLVEHVSLAVRVPVLPEARLEGARVCHLNGARGTVIRYHVDGKPVSYYIMTESPGARGRSEDDTFHVEAQAGYNVIAWRQDGLLHALVGDLPRAKLARLAQMCTGRHAVL